VKTASSGWRKSPANPPRSDRQDSVIAAIHPGFGWKALVAEAIFLSLEMIVSIVIASKSTSLRSFLSGGNRFVVIAKERSLRLKQSSCWN
jgi:hypothetical protein